MSPPDADVDDSVCYRHPDRASWTLCQRCGRTICPECQILTPGGVRCPDCVREAGGSVRWEPAAPRPAAKSMKRKRAPVARVSSGDSPRWVETLREMVRPGSSAPAATWGILVAVGLIWIAGFFTANLPFLALAALPDEAWQVWRYFTSAFVYPSIADARPIISLILSVLFFLLTAPGVERQLGRQRFLVLFLASSAFGAAAMVLAGAPGYGLGGALWGMLGAYLVIVWQHPPARTRFLIMMAIYLLISLLFGGYSLPAIIGGALAGVGASVLFRRYEDRPRSNPRTPYLLIAAGVGGIILIAILRVLVLS